MGNGEGDDRDGVIAPAEQRAGRAVDGDEAGQAGEPGGDGEDVPGDRARTVPGLTRAAGAEVGPEDDIGVEDGDQRVEIPVPGGGEEGVHRPALPAGVGVGHGRSLNATAGPAGQLPGRLRRAVHDRGDLLERYVEHVVQHKGQPLGRAEGLQHHQQRQADGVGGGVALRGPIVDVLEGALLVSDDTRLVVLEFPSAERARAWWDSDSYRPLVKLREPPVADSRAFLVDGIDLGGQR